jgi:hypothetical protein
MATVDNVGQLMSSALIQRAKRLKELRATQQSLKVELDKVQCEYELIANEVMSELDINGVESIKIDGTLFYTETRQSVRIPKSLEDKERFFNYLRDLSLYDEMISVNSATLNSFYKTMSEEAEKDGVLEFQMPGIEPPTSYKQLKIRNA